MGQVQGQDQGQGQGQDHLLLQRAALPQLYLALTLVLTLVLTLDLAQITKLPLLNYLCSLLKKRSRNGFLISEKTNRRHESA